MERADKLYRILNFKLHDILASVAASEEGSLIAGLGSSRVSARCFQETRERWSEYLDSIEGVERMGKLLAMVTDSPEGKVKVKNPIDSESSIFIPEELANKILVLGYIP